jgi:hypothetical protein
MQRRTRPRDDPSVGCLHVRTHANHPWIYPLACMAGHTGARRSELIRMLASDVDFAGGRVVLREGKRVKGLLEVLDFVGGSPVGPTIVGIRVAGHEGENQFANGGSAVDRRGFARFGHVRTRQPDGGPLGDLAALGFMAGLGPVPAEIVVSPIESDDDLPGGLVEAVGWDAWGSGRHVRSPWRFRKWSYYHLAKDL